MLKMPGLWFYIPWESGPVQVRGWLDVLQKMEELEDGLLVYIYILQVPEAKHGSSSFGIDLTG